jgi:hypothetical protein
MYLFAEIRMLPVLILMLVWAAAGWLIAARFFDLPRHERGLLGLGLGLVVSNWLANLLARVLPLPLAFWAAAALALVLGVSAALPIRRELRSMLPLEWGEWLALAALAFFLTLIGRGLAIFDDYQNLPILSRLAAGDIPPHFPFDSDLRLGYHYFLLLLAAQFMRVGQAAPWVALDAARGLTSALALLLLGQLAFRLTGKPVARFAAVVFGAFAGGARWILVLLPPSVLSQVASRVQLIGVSTATSTDLADFLLRSWQIDGSGPVPFPTAFISGVDSPFVMALSGAGTGARMVVLLLFLLGTRVKAKMAWPVLGVLLASLALLNEPEFVVLWLGLTAAIALQWVRSRSLRVAGELGPWIGALALTAFLVLVQGGMFTELARGLVLGGTSQASYFEVGFHPVWPPTVVSSHLGYLSLLDPYQLLVAGLEFGPVILVFPLVLVWGWRALREERWLEAGLALSGVLGVLMVFFQYSGNAGPTATTRLYGGFSLVCWMLAVPLTWRLVEAKREAVQVTALVIGCVSMLSGVVLLSVQLFAAYHPVPSYFLNDRTRACRSDGGTPCRPRRWSSIRCPAER